MLISTDHATQGQARCASSSGQSHRTLRFHCSIPQIFCWRVLYWMVFMLELESSKKKGWVVNILTPHFVLDYITKSQTLPFSKKSLQDMYVTAGQILGGAQKKKYNYFTKTSSLHEKKHLHHQKIQKQQHNSSKTQLLQLQVKRLAYLPYRCALSIHHLYRSHPLWLVALAVSWRR